MVDEHVSATGSRPSPKRRIGFDARRALIVQAALEVFAEQGYHGAALSQITHRAGVTKPVLYDHFPSKADLYLHLLRHERDELLRHIKRRLRPGMSPQRLATEAVTAVFAYVEDHPFAWRLLFRETTGDPEIVDAHRRLQQEAGTEVVRALLAGAPVRFEGEHSELMKSALGELLGGGIRALARWWYDHREVPRERLVAMVLEVLWGTRPTA